MTVFTVLAAAVLVAVSALMILHLGIPRSRLSFVARQCENSARSARQVENMRQIIRAVSVRLSSRLSPVEVLQAIHGSIGEGAYVDNVDVDLVKGTAALGGLAETLKHVNTLVQTLEQTAALKNVQESSPAKMDNNGRFRFQLSAEIGE
jgi:Tfp pilus assembly protein PilN